MTGSALLANSKNLNNVVYEINTYTFRATIQSLQKVSDVSSNAIQRESGNDVRADIDHDRGDNESNGGESHPHFMPDGLEPECTCENGGTPLDFLH